MYPPSLKMQALRPRRTQPVGVAQRVCRGWICVEATCGASFRPHSYMSLGQLSSMRLWSSRVGALRRIFPRIAPYRVVWVGFFGLRSSQQKPGVCWYRIRMRLRLGLRMTPMRPVNLPALIAAGSANQAESTRKIVDRSAWSAGCLLQSAIRAAERAARRRY